jgi:hypothetical protein
MRDNTHDETRKLFNETHIYPRSMRLVVSVVPPSSRAEPL